MPRSALPTALAAALVLGLQGCNEPPFAPEPLVAELLDHDGWSRDLRIHVPALAGDSLFDLILEEVRAINAARDSTAPCYWWRRPLDHEDAVNCLWSDLRILIGGQAHPTFLSDSLTVVATLQPLSYDRSPVELVLGGQRLDLGSIDVAGFVETLALDPGVQTSITPWRNGTALAYSTDNLVGLDLATGRVTPVHGAVTEQSGYGQRNPGPSVYPGHFLINRVSGTQPLQLWNLAGRQEMVGTLPCHVYGPHSVAQVADSLCVVIGKHDMWATRITASGPTYLWYNRGEGAGAAYWALASDGHSVPVDHLSAAWDWPDLLGYPVIGPDAMIQYRLPGFGRVSGAAFSHDSDTLFLAADLPALPGRRDSVLGRTTPFAIRSYHVETGALIESLEPQGDVVDLVRSVVSCELFTVTTRGIGNEVELTVSIYQSSPLKLKGSFSLPVDSRVGRRLVLDEVLRRMYLVDAGWSSDVVWVFDVSGGGIEPGFGR